jgi:CheY-like chemotaxis protein
VLCVDDEPRILEGLQLTLGRRFDVITAASAIAGLSILEHTPEVAVVISDMRMPGMNGAAFLAQVMERWPDSIRLLLTGEPGRDAAVAAINEGQIFRFLTKPCPPERLIAAVDAALRQHQLVTAEKTLLRKTVLGSIQALTDVLAIVNPIAFGRCGRVKRLAIALAASAGVAPNWELEAAALMSQVGFVSLPVELVEKAANGEPLDEYETLLVGEVPTVTQSLLARIPRLENVAAILAHANFAATGGEAPSADIEANAAVLMNVLAFDALITRGASPETAIATLRGRGGLKNAALLARLAALQGATLAGPQKCEVRLRDVCPGMIMRDDLRTEEGTLLASSGYEISQSFIDKMKGFGPGLLDERVWVSPARTDDSVC